MLQRYCVAHEGGDLLIHMRLNHIWCTWLLIILVSSIELRMNLHCKRGIKIAQVAKKKKIKNYDTILIYILKFIREKFTRTQFIWWDNFKKKHKELGRRTYLPNGVGWDIYSGRGFVRDYVRRTKKVPLLCMYNTYVGGMTKLVIGWIKDTIYVSIGGDESVYSRFWMKQCFFFSRYNNYISMYVVS